MKILAMDSSNISLSLALLDGDSLAAEVTTNTRIRHSKQLLPLLETLVTSIGWTPRQLEAVVVTAGPGSYTGLRIGATTAKTLAWTLDIPLYTVSSLLALAGQAPWEADLVLPFFDARRQAAFAGAYQRQGETWTAVLPDQYTPFADWLDQIKDAVSQADAPCFISPDLAVFEEAIQARFGGKAAGISGAQAVIRAENLPSLPIQKTDPDTFVPDYGKLAEAEEIWRAKHPAEAQEGDGHYVERAD